MFANLFRLLFIGLLGTVLWSPKLIWLAFVAAFGLMLLVWLYFWASIAERIDPSPCVLVRRYRK